MSAPFSPHRAHYQESFELCRSTMFIAATYDWAFEEVTDHCRHESDWDRAYEFFTPFTH